MVLPRRELGTRKYWEYLTLTRGRLRWKHHIHPQPPSLIYLPEIESKKGLFDVIEYGEIGEN